MKPSLLLLSAALLLSACSSGPQSPGAAKGKALIQVLSLPAEVQQVTLEVRGTDENTRNEARSLTATLTGGTATFTVPDLVKGAYTLTARAYDGTDAEKVVLYKGSRQVTFADEQPINLRINRITSAIQVTVAGVTAKSNVLIAKAGALEARLIGNGDTASGTLRGIPTGRAVRVIVEGRDSGGTLQQQGTATLRLSEEDGRVSVGLTDVVNATAPAVPTLSGADTVKKGEAYTLNIAARQADASASLKTVTVDWGDGSTQTIPLSGQEAEVHPTHVYTAPGPRSISVTVTNTANLSSTAGNTVNVLDTTTGNVTVETGAEVAPLHLTVTDVEAERVTATITAPQDSLGTASLRAQDLQKSYALELVPRGNGTWSGALSLPVGYAYTVQPHAIAGEQVREGQSRTLTVLPEGTSASLAFGGDAAPTCPAATITNIGAVQGNGATSPLVGQTVTVRGVVTSDFQAGLGGFFVQEIAPDNDPATSDGLFVYTGPTARQVQVGDVVQVGGTVREYRGSSDKQPGTATQLDTLTLFQKCSGTQVVKPVTLSFPLNTLDQLEQYENMLVTIPQPMTVTDNYGYGRYGELGLSSGGRLFVPTNGNAPSETAASQALRRIVLNDGSNVQNPAALPYLNASGTRRTGDTVQNLTGVLRYANDTFKIEPTVTPQFTDANPRSATPKPVGGRLRVAGANVLNYFITFGGSTDRGANNAYEFGRQQAKIVSTLLGLKADVISLMEIQNNGDAALEDLVAALNRAAGAGTYAAVKTGQLGSDAITVALIYRPDRVTPVGNFLADTASINDRPPVAQTFRENATGEVFSVIANHFKSKGSCPTSGDTDQGQGCWNFKRVAQAQALLDFVKTVQATSGDPDVLLLGDLNAYGDEDPIKTLISGGFESLNRRIPAEDRYSYQFGGQFGYLDHALASASLSGQVTGITEWHVNSDEPTFLDYNVEYKNNPNCKTSTCTTPDLYQPDAFRSSDHDPVLVGLDLKGGGTTSPVPSVALTPGTATVTAVAGAPAVTRTFTATAQNVTGALTVTVTPQNGAPPLVTAPATVTSGQPFDVTVTAPEGTTAGTYSYELKAAGGDVSGKATLTVTVQAPPATNTADLYFSEYVEGSGSNKAIELYNPTGQAVNLGDYTVELYTNGAAAPTNTVTLSGTLAAGSTFVIVNASAVQALKDKGQLLQSSVTSFNGDDALVLKKNGVVIDTFGQVGFDPGSAWISGDVTTLDRTLRRKTSVTTGDPNPSDPFDPAAQWDVFPTDTFDGLGTR
ncbi:ExeM/NucH family extracellular endonuclease [Deinococcus sp. YIM 77859]|uniref:ExeM/NucH family extracellular endonuclease n=1 Tax=Deinococcus sp. YIM 77859 TaxID=1540221 RepID=UPI000690BE2B|nr:ExeM/NucH family extracellular endonuclease [Deinococcus sp. YIM 77859]